MDAHFDEKLITYRSRDGKLTLYLLVLANLFKEGQGVLILSCILNLSAVHAISSNKTKQN